MKHIKDFLKSGALLSRGDGKVIIAWGKRRFLQKPNNQSVPFFYFPDFFLSNPLPYVQYPTFVEIDLDELLKHLSQLEIKKCPLRWASPSRPLFESDFQVLQSLFASQSLKKAVPYLFLTAEGNLGPADLAASLVNLLKYAKSAPLFLYGFWDEKEGMLGATPELLLEWGGGADFRTAAVAGTVPREKKQLLREDLKLLDEHRLVVEGIIEELQPFGRVVSEPTEILELPTLCHLKTSITLTSSALFDDPTPLIHVLHPTPALGGFPKGAASRWLLDFESKTPRGRFGAPVGVFYQKKATCYVAIRNVQWSNQKLKIGAGCGVMPQSQLEAEWEELLLKLRSIQELLDL